MMKTGPLTEVYRSSALEMGEYHGWEMPAVFSSVEREFDAAIRRAALVDQSPVGRIEISGDDRLDFLHRLSTNELLKARPRSVVSTVLTNEKGRVIDAAAACLKSDRILLLVSPANEGVVIPWLAKYHITEDIRFRDITFETAMASLIGPLGRPSIQACYDVELPTNAIVEVDTEAGPLTIVCAETSRLPILHLIGTPAVISGMWKALLRANVDQVLPMGTVAYEAYRISRGVAAIGSELTGAFNPLEIGLREAVSATKGCYIGQEVLARLDTYKKVRRKLVGLVFSAAFAHRQEPIPLRKNSEEVGLVTSWMDRPLHGKYVGLGVVSTDAVREGDQVRVVLPDRELNAIALSIPMLVQGASVA